jgi:hypothetical protein
VNYLQIEQLHQHQMVTGHHLKPLQLAHGIKVLEMVRKAWQILENSKPHLFVRYAPLVQVL